MGLSFPKLMGLKPGQTAVFSWIVYKSRSHRDKVNAKVMRDPRLKDMPDPMPFEAGRMSWGGFQVLVAARQPRPTGRQKTPKPVRATPTAETTTVNHGQ